MHDQMIDDYIRIKALIKDEANKQYAELLKENPIKYSGYSNYQDIEEMLIAEYIQLEEFSK